MAYYWGKFVSVVRKIPIFSRETEQTKSGSDSSLGCQQDTQDCIQQLRDAVKEKSTLLERTERLSVYKVPLTDEQISVAGCKLYSFGKEFTKQKRTIMVLGATGAGKSTLINGMINYILGVEWKDLYRFKLVSEDQTKSQAESQTSEVTVYKINHQEGFKIDYSVTIVDTPGFGDTRGIERDREIAEQLRNLFSSDHGVREIDAVCFVAQASLARLTPPQKYVFDSVLSIFGKDIAENIRILVTFADGQRPPVLEAIIKADVPCSKTKDGQPVHFKFNNSALFANNTSPAADSMMEDDEEGNFDKMFWNMGTRSMARFFNALNFIETKSLTMTKEVLKERQQLEVSVEGLQKQVKLGLAKLEEIKETTEKLKEFEAEISRNENFEFDITVKKPFQVDISGTGKYITNCQQCNFTCHDKCIYAADEDKIKCSAMGRDGYCKVCPGKCIWSVHFHQKYRWEYKEVTEKQTLNELKKKYDIAKEAKSPVEAMIGRLRAEYSAVQAEVERLIEKSSKCLNKLRKIALRPNPLSTPEYIDMLIEGEKSEAKSGWKKRVQSLEDIRKKAQTMAQVASGEKLLLSPLTDLSEYKAKQKKKSSHNKKTFTNHSTNKTKRKKQNKPGTDSIKSLNEKSTNANQDTTETPKDKKSEPDSDENKTSSKSQHSVLDGNTHQEESNLNTNDQDCGAGTNQDQGNQYTNNGQYIDLDTETDQDKVDEGKNKVKVVDLEMIQDHEANQSQNSGHYSDPDEDQGDPDCSKNQEIYPDTDQSNYDPDSGQEGDPDVDQDKDQGHQKNEESYLDCVPDEDQRAPDSSKDQDINLDTDQSNQVTNNGQDSDHDADPEQDQGNQATQKGQKSYLYLDPGEDQGDQDSMKSQDIYLDPDQSDHDTNSGQDSDHDADPDEDQCYQGNQKEEDSYLDHYPEEDQGDPDNSKDYGIYHDTDQSDHDPNIGQDSDHDADPDEDQCYQNT